MRPLLKHFRKDQQGAAVVEAAFVLPLFLLFVLGIIEFGRLYWVRSSMQLAITEAGRHVMVNTSASDSELTSIVQSSLYGLNSSNFSLNFSNQVTSGIPFKVISATYQYTFFASGILPFGPLTMTATTTVPVLP